MLNVPDFCHTATADLNGGLVGSGFFFPHIPRSQIVDDDCRAFWGDMVGVRAVAHPPPPSPTQAVHLTRARLSIEANPWFNCQTSISS